MGEFGVEVSDLREAVSGSTSDREPLRGDFFRENALLKELRNCTTDKIKFIMKEKRGKNI